MHELSLVQGMLAQVKKLMREHEAAKVSAISVVIGPFSGVVADSFLFAFDTLKKTDPSLNGAVLQLTRPDPCYLCLDCGAECSLPFSKEQGIDARQCKACGSVRLSPVGGDELVLQQIRME